MISARRIEKLMGNRFEFTAICTDSIHGEKAIEAAIAEVRRIEELLTTFKETSQANQINKLAGISPVVVDKEVISLVERSLRISELTQGAFDLSYGSIDKSLWNFDLTMKTLPDREQALRSVRLINYKNILVDRERSSILLKHKGMRIGFGGIGKGYAADRARQVLISLGIENGVVNAAGDLITWGKQPDGRPWTVGIADPNQQRSVFSAFNISDMAVATSGDYEKYVEIDGKRYSHTIDPKTGLPVSGIKSVTMLSPSAELADAMATPVMVMGIEVGLDLIDQMRNLACVIVDSEDRIFTSKNINIKL